MNCKVERVLTWDEFKELLTKLYPEEIYYAQAKAPLSRPPIALRLTFANENVQYVFIDTAKDDSLRRTRIPIREDKYRNLNLEEEDIKKFIYTQLGRTDIKIRSFELVGGY
ncbi:MAG: hypothetical protein OEY24_08210 [Candidatus Bathyarchaeota archaeon]|nr:hypothetical protein [Candidatus Bathyarchaeota archaeon]MDH5495666.1 hypothetical protein [Candidatus Bathyarchaeota archaeon]